MLWSQRSLLSWGREFNHWWLHCPSSGAWSVVQRLWWKQVKGKESSSWQQCFGGWREEGPSPLSWGAGAP